MNQIPLEHLTKSSGYCFEDIEKILEGSTYLVRKRPRQGPTTFRNSEIWLVQEAYDALRKKKIGDPKNARGTLVYQAE